MTLVFLSLWALDAYLLFSQYIFGVILFLQEGALGRGRFGGESLSLSLGRLKGVFFPFDLFANILCHVAFKLTTNLVLLIVFVCLFWEGGEH